MDNNQFNNQFNNQNNFGQPMQQPVNNFSQPVQQPVNNYGLPAYQQPVQMNAPMQPKKNNAGLIVGVIIGVVVLLAVVGSLFNGNAKKIDGKWTCTGSSGTLTIDADASAKTVKMTLGSFVIDAKYKVSGSAKPSKKKDGYKYTQYVFTSGSNSTGTTYSSSKKIGFIFGINKDNENEAHYVDSTSSTAIEFTCKKSS